MHLETAPTRIEAITLDNVVVCDNPAEPPKPDPEAFDVLAELDDLCVPNDESDEQIARIKAAVEAMQEQIAELESKLTAEQPPKHADYDAAVEAIVDEHCIGGDEKCRCELREQIRKHLPPTPLGKRFEGFIHIENGDPYGYGFFKNEYHRTSLSRSPATLIIHETQEGAAAP